jgi:diguanylate cyclase (GGDEF)-like protein/PAS domain S-box-containing protein
MPLGTSTRTTMLQAPRFLETVSFRTRIVAALLAVEAAALAFLVWEASVIELQRVDREFQAELGHTRSLLNAAVHEPLAARDTPTLKKVLEESVTPGGLRYLVAKDARGDTLAAAGTDGERPDRTIDATLEDAFDDRRYDTVRPLASDGAPLGTLHVGISLDRQLAAMERSSKANVQRSFFAFIFSVLVLMAVMQPFARRLARLQNAAERISSGDYAVKLDDEDSDEVGRLARAFYRMADVVRMRVEELEKSREEFHAIADYTYDVECWVSPEGDLRWINSSVERLTGYSARECIATKSFPWFPVHPEDLVRVHLELSRALRQRTTGTNFEFRITRKDAAVEWLSSSWQPVFDPEGEFLGMRLSVYSIQQLKQVEIDLRETLARLEVVNELQSSTAESLRAEQSRLLSLLSAMSFGVVFVDRGRRIVYANPMFSEVWSLHGGEALLGSNLFHVLESAEDGVADMPAFTARVAELLADHRRHSTIEIRLASGRLLKLQVCPVLDGEKRFQGSVLLHEDVTQAREAQSQLAFLAERDPLTGLHNRRSFEQQLMERLQSASRGHERTALFLFDLDEFKSVNDLFGHRMGDQVLLQVASEVRAQLRASEFFARIGGDEFALVVSDADDGQIRSLAERLMQVIGSLSISVGEVRLSMTSSLGIAISPDHSADVQELISHADAAMYQAKDAGKNTWRIYQPDHTATLRQRSLVTWNDRLRHALRTDAFEVHLQGVFGTNDRKLRYSEALLRMRDEATGRPLPPSQFIPFAEKSNLIVDIDRWMIAAVIDLLAADPERAPIAVNVSGRSFDEPDIPAFIERQLAACGVAPARLHVEITETSAIRDAREAQRFIERLQATGCKVALDDFGAGFATFSYIKQLPVDVLKIDGLFIRNLARSRDNQVFVKAMLDIARGFGKQTVAEAVEDEECLEVLRAYGVDMVQGYALERPQPAPLRSARASLAAARMPAPAAAETRA